MIVKNESRVIERCLESVKPYIDAYAIVDTGSTDGTQKIIRECLKDFEGKVVDEPWKGFAKSRQDALDLARQVVDDQDSDDTWYFMTLDADEVLIWPKGHTLADKLTDDMYGIRFSLVDGESTWQRTFLGKMSLPWKWVGDVHESLDCGERELTRTLLTGAHIDSYTDGARARKRKYSLFDQLDPAVKAWSTAKYRSDAKTLEGMNPLDPRTVFYLAQSYCGAREIDKAIAMYEKRAAMAGFSEEIYYSLFQIAALKEARGDNWQEVVQYHLKAYEARPVRAEPLWALAVIYNDRKMPAVAEVYARAAATKPRPTDCLLVMESVYQFRAADELAAALGLLRRYDEALDILQTLQKIQVIPAEDRKRIEENIDFILSLKREAA